MFSRRKETGKKPSRSSGGLAQYGLMDIPDMSNIENMNDFDGEDDDDADLEAELLALTSGSGPVRRKPKPKASPVPANQLDKMVADSLKDIPSDASLSGDDDDPELLEELGGLIGEEDELSESPPQEKPSERPPAPAQALDVLLMERLTMYQQAELNAKKVGDSSRARRFTRGIKTLQDLLKQAKAGRPIDEADIPPPVVVQISAPKETQPENLEPQVLSPDLGPQLPIPESVSPPPVPERTESLPAAQGTTPPPIPPRTVPKPQRIAPPPPSPGAVPLPGLIPTPMDINEPEKEDLTQYEKENMLKILVTRQNEYKMAAVKAKKAGNLELALNYVKVSKQFDVVIQAVEEGKPVDLSSMPSPPPQLMDEAPQLQREQLPPVPPRLPARQEEELQHSSEPPPQLEPETEQAEVYSVTYSTVTEALEERLKLYQSQESAAQEAGNTSKARRMGRIVKQYKDAIKLNNAGKPIPVDELPNPPGYAPIPVKGSTVSANSKPPVSVPTSPAVSLVDPPAPSIPSPKLPISQPENEKTEDETPKSNVRKKAGSRVERQLSLLTLRQKEFKVAALEAKRNGEINQAKEYLRLAKGFDPLIDAANSGLPIDMDTVPLPPASKDALESDFSIVTAEECIPNSDTEMYAKLENDLVNQLKKCKKS